MSIFILREAIFVKNLALNYDVTVEKNIGRYEYDKSISTWCEW